MSTTHSTARRTLADLQPGERIEDEVYVVAQKDLRTTANGSLYIHAVLRDKTGQMVARMWNASESIFSSIPDGGFVRFRGRVESYKGKPQFIIDGVRTVDEGSIDPTDFLPSTPHDVEKMWARVMEILRNIKNPELLALVGKFVNDEQFVAAFKRAPAAMQLHHAYIGGLLEHTLNLLELALLVIPRYPRVSLDLVLTGILLHDAGKTRELAYETNLSYTNQGQLIGHLVQVTIWVHTKVRELEAETGRQFPQETLDVLTHLILAHHGQYEFGSPKLPATPEAIAVHYLDNLDAKLNLFLTEIDKDPDDESDWTSYIPALGTKIFKPDVISEPEK